MNWISASSRLPETPSRTAFTRSSSGVPARSSGDRPESGTQFDASTPSGGIIVGTGLDSSHRVAPHVTGEVQADERGRVTVPKDVRDCYGDRYRPVELDSGIRLVPIPDDPVKELRSVAGDELCEASLDELEDAAPEETRRQTGEHVR